MPEILTESFCERCGTRYTFESAAPRKTRRLGQIKTLSKGMKNWVMSDDTSLDEAMAAARNDDDRELTSQQLDAFHATFNFCMTCRQYTCGNCWNTAEGRCLTCAPHLGHEVLPAPFPDQAPFEPVRIEAESWPVVDFSSAVAAAHENGHGNGFHPEVIDPWAGAGTADAGGIAEIDPAARLAFLSGETPAPVLEPEAEGIAGSPAWTDATAPAWPGADIPAWPAADAAAAAADRVADTAPSESQSPALAAGEAPAASDEAVDDWARTGTARTSDLLRRFRPGQNIDAELAAFEAEQERAEANASAEAPDTAEPVWAEPLVEAVAERAPEPIPATPEPELPIAASAEWPVEPTTEPAEPKAPALPRLAWAPPAKSAAPEAPAPGEPVAPAPLSPIPPSAPAWPPAPAWPIAEPAAEPIAAALPREDRIPQPTWQVFAPDADAPGTQPAATPVPAPPQPFGVGNDPQWPANPELSESPAMALLANHANRTSDALWAASAQEVLARPAAAPAGVQTAGTQPCSSCGLSLSATARFCRRCGTRQG